MSNSRPLYWFVMDQRAATDVDEALVVDTYSSRPSPKQLKRDNHQGMCLCREKPDHTIEFVGAIE